LRHPFDQVWSDDALSSGLAKLSKAPHQVLPASAEAWLSQAHPGNHLLLLDSLRPASRYGTPQIWRERLAHLEQHWFAPLEQALRNGEIELTLHTPTSSGTLSFNVTRGKLWKLWRRSRAMIHYRPGEFGA
jgi:hypothetical protein